MTAEDNRNISLRLIAFGSRLAHKLSGGRIGSLEPGKSVPTGRTLQIITAVHRRVYRWTGGMIGSNLGGLATLLLTTTGRKSGVARTVPLPYFPHPEGVMIVASFAGSPKNPAWYDNLVANPEVEVQIKSRRYRAIATAAGPDERPAVWESLIAVAPHYADYQKLTSREIPIVILREKL